MKRLLLVFLLFCGLPAWTAFGQPPQMALDAIDQDQMIRREIVPSAEQPQGEVQLIKRGDLLVVRTLLASRILKRVAAVIDDKERRNWPETREGHAASRRYREELFKATEKSWDMFRQRSDQSEVRQFLAIEFILGSKKGEIVLSLPVIEGGYGQMEIVGQQLVKNWRATDRYVLENMIEIVKDSFRLGDTAADELLAPYLPGEKQAGN